MRASGMPAVSGNGRLASESRELFSPGSMSVFRSAEQVFGVLLSLITDPYPPMLYILGILPPMVPGSMSRPLALPCACAWRPLLASSGRAAVFRNGSSKHRHNYSVRLLWQD